MQRRWSRNLLPAAVLTAIFLVSSPHAQQLGQQLGELQQQVIATYRSGNYELAAKQGEANAAIVRQHLGDRHPVYAIAIGWNARIYTAMDRLDEAELLSRQAVAILQKTAQGSEYLAQAHSNLANVLYERGRYVEAESWLKTALSLYERNLPPDHPDVGLTLHNLAALYRETGRLDEAEPILKRAVAIAERSQSDDLKIHVTTEYAFFHRAKERFETAQKLLEQVVALREKSLPPQHPQLAASLHELGLTYSKRKLWPEAERTLRRTLDIREKVLPPTHSATAATMSNLAVVYEEQGKFSQSETLKKRSLAILEKVLPDDHHYLATQHQNLSTLYFRKQDWRAALDHIRKANAILIKRGDISSADLVGHATSFALHVAMANRAGANDASLREETFGIAQRAMFTLAGYSLDQMASRQATGNTPLGAVVRQQQDMERRWRGLDQALTAAVAKGDTAGAEQLRKEVLGFATSYLGLQQRIRREFPEYADLVTPKPLPLADVQKLLRPNEALFLVMSVGKQGAIPVETYGWVVTQDDSRWFRVAMSPEEIAAKVHRLRCALDFAAWFAGDRPSCEKEFKGARSTDMLPFDYAASHQLYAALFGPAEDLIRNKHLLVVPSGSLAQLPFYVLVTEKPAVALGSSAPLNREMSWLLKKNTVTVLPSVAALKSLRRTSKKMVAPKPMIGFGNPLLNGFDNRHAEAAKLARAKQNCQQMRASPAASSSRAPFRTARSLRTRNGVVDVADIASQTPLPETADELCAVAGELGAAAEDIYLGSRFSETEVKKLSEADRLSSFRIVHFATHGVLADSFRENAEPGLVLTPPRQGSPRDDGYLTASEIAGLRLNADLVILSACYTAGGSQDDRDALAGMASAFFYAGARSALVSHWAVVSDSTVKLIIGTVKRAADGKTDRADAIRQSMLELLTSGEPMEANPAFWAPFVLVGEGAL